MTINVQLFLILNVIYQVKHFIADFVLQNVWMLQKGKAGWDFLLPLSIHCGVHAGFTLAIVLVVNPSLWWLTFLDFGIHFVMDRFKAGPRYLGRFSDIRSQAYWVCFGLDQMVHHLTHIYICWVLAGSGV